MARFIVRRLFQMLFVMFAVSVLIFLIFNVIPNGDPAVRMAGRQAQESTTRRSARSGASTRACRAVRHHHEEDLHRRADSYSTQLPVNEEILKGIPRTFSLAIGAALLWMFFAICFGLYSAMRAGEVRRSLPHDPRPGRHLDARVLDRGADEPLPGLQARLVPERRLRRVHRGPGRLVLPPDSAVDRALDPVHRLLLARAALERARHDQRGLRAHGAREGPRRSARS